MQTTPRFASVRAAELAAAAVALVLLIAAADAAAQTPGGVKPAAAPPPPSAVPSAPPVNGSSTTAPPKVDASGKPVLADKSSRVLADPDTRMYSRCAGDDEHASPGGEPDRDFKPNPKAEVMSEEAAKAKGFRAGAHKVHCG